MPSSSLAQLNIPDTHLRCCGPGWIMVSISSGVELRRSSSRLAGPPPNGLHSCVAVSDAYHVFRIRKLLEYQGLGPVYVAPRPDSLPHSVVQRTVAALREATSYLLWKLGMT